MRSRDSRARAWLIAASPSAGACAGVLLAADRASACAVCFGDPETPMAKGVVAGVVVLIAVVGVVLAGIVGTGLCWMQRSRRLNRTGQPEQPGDEPTHHRHS